MIINEEISRLFTVALAITAYALTLLSFTLGSLVTIWGIDSGFFYKLFQLFNLDFERNIPTWFSSTLLSFSALILLLITYHSHRLKKEYLAYWLILSLIFFTLSADEFIQFHEQTIRPIRSTLDTGGLFYNAWIIPAGGVVIIIGLLYLRFVLKLPQWLQKSFFSAAALYIGAVLVVEAVGGYYFERALQPLDTQYDIVYLLITHVEELLEMIGLIIFLSSLLRYLRQLCSVNNLIQSADTVSRDINYREQI